MLGVRLSAETQERLERHARQTGRAKSVLVREWIAQALERESVDAQMARAAEVLARTDSEEDRAWFEGAQEAVLRALDEEDGGYDWGPKGPPA